MTLFSMSLLSDDSQFPSNSLSVIIVVQGDEISACSAKKFGLYSACMGDVAIIIILITITVIHSCLLIYLNTSVDTEAKR